MWPLAGLLPNAATDVVNDLQAPLIACLSCGNMPAASVTHLTCRQHKRATRDAPNETENLPMPKPRISYVDPATVKDEAMLAEFDRCRREGTPRPESQAIRAHVPAVFWSFANSWRDVFKNGVADHAIKELCRIYVSRSVKCEYCGNQRSMKAASQGIVEDDYRD